MDFGIKEDIRAAQNKQHMRAVLWAFFSFIVCCAVTQDLLTILLISILGSLVGYMLSSLEVRELENKRIIGGKR